MSATTFSFRSVTRAAAAFVCLNDGPAVGPSSREGRHMRRAGLYAVMLMAGGLVAAGATPAAATTTPTIAIGDASVVEGDSGARTLTFAVTLSEAGSADVAVAATITAGNATAGTDFNDKAGKARPLSFKVKLSGATPVVKYVSVPVYPDLAPEGDETVHVTLSAPSEGWTLGRSLGVGTIVDDDATTKSGIEIAVSDATVHEGDATKRAAKVSVTLSAPPTAGEVRVSYAIDDGSADCGPMRAAVPVVATDDCFDNAGKTKLLRFRVGQRSKLVPATVFPDTTPEPDESFAIRLSDPIGATVIDPTGTVTIIDDDPPLTTVPGMPTLTSAVAGPANGMLVVSWDPPDSDGGSELTGYELEITRPADIVVGTYTATAANVVCGSPGVTCGLRVRAINAVGAGPWSDSLAGTTWRAPDPVGDLIVSPGVHVVHATWSTPTDAGDFPIIDYRISRSTDGTNFEFVTFTAVRAATVACVGERATCWVRVEARNAAGLGAPTETTGTTWGRPGSPTLDTIRRIGTDVGLGWTPPADDGGVAIFEYTGERTIDGGATWLGIGSVQFTLPTCPIGTSCGFRISAVNVVGASAPSNVLTVGP